MHEKCIRREITSINPASIEKGKQQKGVCVNVYRGGAYFDVRTKLRMRCCFHLLVALNQGCRYRHLFDFLLVSVSQIKYPTRFFFVGRYTTQHRDAAVSCEKLF